MKFRFCGDLDCPDWVLAEINTLSKMSSVRIKIVVVQILSYCLESTFNYEKVLKLAADNADGISDIKGAIAAVHFMLTNAAKNDLDERSLVQEIQQLGLPKENSDAVARQYREYKEALQKKFFDDSYRVSKLISTDWRVDHIIGASSPSTSVDSNYGEKQIAVNGSVAHFRLRVDMMPELGSDSVNGGSYEASRTKDIAWEASAEKLDVLIYELAQAKKLLESTK